MLKRTLEYSSCDSKNYLLNRISCYTLSKKETDNTPKITALNEKPVPGKTVAVSRDLSFMLGKYIYIHGYGVWYVNDLMNRRFKKSIDLCLDENICKRFSNKKHVLVSILYSSLM